MKLVRVWSFNYDSNKHLKMEEQLSPQDLDSELHKEPFLPFCIVTTTGKSYQITGGDVPLVLVGKRTVIIGFRGVAERDPHFERYEVVSLNHIVRLEPMPQTQAVT